MVVVHPVSTSARTALPPPPPEPQLRAGRYAPLFLGEDNCWCSSSPLLVSLPLPLTAVHRNVPFPPTAITSYGSRGLNHAMSYHVGSPVFKTFAPEAPRSQWWCLTSPLSSRRWCFTSPLPSLLLTWPPISGNCCHCTSCLVCDQNLRPCQNFRER